MIFDGSPRPTAAMRREYPLCRVHRYISRSAAGKAYYDVRTGRDAFFPDPNGSPDECYFAGEEIRPQLPVVEAVEPPAVAEPKPEQPAEMEASDGGEVVQAEDQNGESGEQR